MSETERLTMQRAKIENTLTSAIQQHIDDFQNETGIRVASLHVDIQPLGTGDGGRRAEVSKIHANLYFPKQEAAA